LIVIDFQGVRRAERGSAILCANGLKRVAMTDHGRVSSTPAEDLAAIRSRRRQAAPSGPVLAPSVPVAERAGAVSQSPAGEMRPSELIAMQRLVGNGAVQRHLARSAGRDFRVQSAPPMSTVQRVGTIISAPTLAGKSAHPTLSKDAANNAEAVSEAQQKLATSSDGPASLPATGTFDDATEKAVKAFRVKNGLSDAGTIDKATWDLLDAQGKSSVGRVERPWEQNMVDETGATYVQGMTSKYSYKIDDTKITVTVGINFVPDATHPPPDLAAVVNKWKTRILGRWNQFKAAKAGTPTDSRDIVFEIASSGGNTVNVINAMVGSDAENWSVPDNENDNGPAHEFGHMIGLEDEYKRGIDDYTKLHPESTTEQITGAKGAFFGGEQFTDEASMMGTGALSGHADKSADPEPRHVREFVSFVEKFLGGTWEAKKK